MEWVDLATAGEWLLTGWVFAMVIAGLWAIVSDSRRRRRDDHDATRGLEEER